MLAILRQRRWIGFTLLTLFFMALFTRLAIWQLHRRAERVASNRVISAQLNGKPLSYSTLLADAGSDRRYFAQHQWRTVTVTGTWDAAHQFLLRNTTLGDNYGYDVITPIVPATGPALLVDRGWIPEGRTSAGPNSVPTPANGSVTIRAWLQPSQSGAAPHGIPAGEVLIVNAPSMARDLPYPLLNGYAQLVHESPGSPHAPSLQPAPTLNNGPHLAYAVEWCLFSCIALGGWYVYVRRAAEDAAIAAAEAKTSGAQAAPQPEPVPATVAATTGSTPPSPNRESPGGRKEVKLPGSIQQIG